MAITRKIEVETCYTASVHQYVSENVIKFFCDFGAIFWKKPWTIALGIFQIFEVFLKWPQLEKLKSKSAQTCYTASVHQYVSENVIKKICDFGAIFWKKTMDYSLRYFSDF